MATDNQAFRFRGDGSVVISDPLGDAVSVSEPAFRALLVRLLDVLVDIAERRGDPVTGSAEWSVLAAARDQLRRARPYLMPVLAIDRVKRRLTKM